MAILLPYLIPFLLGLLGAGICWLLKEQLAQSNLLGILVERIANLVEKVAAHQGGTDKDITELRARVVAVEQRQTEVEMELAKFGRARRTRAKRK